MTARYLTLKDMTRGAGCTPRTVRYYERLGLLRAARSTGGHRLFASSELERLQFVVGLREAGWALEEIVELFGAREAASSDAQAVDRIDSLLERHIDRLETKLERLGRLRDELRQTYRTLRVCHDCTANDPDVSCQGCERLPGLESLPRGFRLTWRARELDPDGPRFDEGGADGGA